MACFRGVKKKLSIYMVKTKKITRYMTPKKKKFLSILSSNLGEKGFTKSIEAMLREAGYSKTTARQHSLTLATIKPMKEYKDITEGITGAMSNIRDKAIKELENSKSKFSKAGLRDLMYSIDTLNKNIQLLRGDPTSIEHSKSITGFAIIQPTQPPNEDKGVKEDNTQDIPNNS